jgi:hypothetical protein
MPTASECLGKPTLHVHVTTGLWHRLAPHRSAVFTVGWIVAGITRATARRLCAHDKPRPSREEENTVLNEVPAAGRPSRPLIERQVSLQLFPSWRPVFLQRLLGVLARVHPD